MARFWMIFLLVLIWMGFSNDYSVLNLLFGTVISSACHFVIMNKPMRYHIRPYRLLIMIAYVLYELVISSAQVAAEIIRPKRLAKPDIISIQLACQSDLERTLMANLISLTPGTLSININKQTNELLMHVMFNHKTDETVAFLKDHFEPKITKVFHG